MAVAPHFSSFWCSVSCYGVVVSMFVLQVGDPGSNPGGSRLLEAISALLCVCVILISEGCGKRLHVPAQTVSSLMNEIQTQLSSGLCHD